MIEYGIVRNRHTAFKDEGENGQDKRGRICRTSQRTMAFKAHPSTHRVLCGATPWAIWRLPGAPNGFPFSPCFGYLARCMWLRRTGCPIMDFLDMCFSSSYTVAQPCFLANPVQNSTCCQSNSWRSYSDSVVAAVLKS